MAPELDHTDIEQERFAEEQAVHTAAYKMPNQVAKNKSIMRIYISGKITGLDPDTAKQLFAAAEKPIREKGCVPVNPMTLVPYIDGWTWDQYMIEDIKLIFSSDALFMLHNWRDSKGARCEHALAEVLGKQIFYQDSLI